MTVTRPFAEHITLALREHRIKHGIAALDGAQAELGRIGPEWPRSADLMLVIAQWVDLGYRDYRFLDPLILRFVPECRRRLPIEEYLALRMVEGFRALSAGDTDSAIETLDLVLRFPGDLVDEGRAALAHFWKGRAHRKKGEYERSLADIARARQLSEDKCDCMAAAVIQIHESWLLFQKGMTREALHSLASAESVLQSTDHYVALGNIESARGRIVRRAGEYTKALEYFTRAMDLYAGRDPRHVNLARSLVNAAYARRLLALQIRKKLNHLAKSGRSLSRVAAHPKSPSSESLRARYQELSKEALQNLHRARQIYQLHANTDGIGKVALNLGYLHLDRGDIERATPEAAEAYRTGVEQDDHILTARARILQATIENAHLEEQTGEDVDVAVHANRALEYSEEALKLAHGTQNLRLLAGACIARGVTAANDFFQDWEEARRCSGEASGLIVRGDNDHLAEDLSRLKSRIVQASGINDTLRGWSEGMLGSKTFQQVSEEFAEIVIPKVWLREDKKIARVAARLSISPKKVRRILRNSGSLRHEL